VSKPDTLESLGSKLCNEVNRLRDRNAELLAALKDIQSQCAGHADEFSANVWRIAENAIAEKGRGYTRKNVITGDHRF
jgi:hypothetical protein